MLIWGWGRKNVVRQVSEQQALVLTYRYVHLMWFLRWSWGLQYQVATLTPQGWLHQPMTREHARESGADQQVTLNPWWRWSLPIALGMLLVTVLVSIVVSTASA